MSEHNSDKAEPNLTPLLDMVFQLITFFMLVINFKGASLDLSLKLPVLGSARPLERHGKLEPLLLNIDAEGRVTVQGKKIDVEQFITREARFLKNQLQILGTPIDKDGELPVPVIVRADRSAPFHLVNHILKICQDQGYRQFSLSAMTREEKH
jgi:biopolymer transport protein ExbD